MVLRFACASKLPGMLGQPLIAGPHPQSFWFSGSGVEPRMCIFDKFPGDTNTAGPRTTCFENHCPTSQKMVRIWEFCGCSFTYSLIYLLVHYSRPESLVPFLWAGEHLPPSRLFLSDELSLQWGLNEERMRESGEKAFYHLGMGAPPALSPAPASIFPSSKAEAAS